MIRVVIAVVMVAAACSYSAPDYDGTHFQCGDLDRCPPGQVCTDGSCVDEGSQGDGVLCAIEVCGRNEQCCFDGAGPALCIPAAAKCPGPTAL